jgi:hypothetical protein
MVKRISAPKKGRAAAGGKRKSVAFKGRPAPAPAPRRRKGGGKRSFRKFSVKDPFRGKGSDGAEVDASPFELSMNSVRLTRKDKVLGMDETRRKTQRKLIWYWQFSRNWQVSRAWNWRQISEAYSIGAEKSAEAHHDDDEGQKHSDWIWFWRWRDRQNKKKRRSKRGKGPLSLSPKRVRLIGISEEDERDEEKENLAKRRRQEEAPKARNNRQKSREGSNQTNPGDLAKLLHQSEQVKITRRVGMQIDSKF